MKAFQNRPPFPSFLAKGRWLTVSVFLQKRNVELLLSRLSAQKIPVLGLKIGENSVKVKVRAQDYPLAIAIFRRMCYTVSEPQVGGALALAVWAVKRVGITLGILIFLLSAFLSRPYVLAVEYRGSAAFRKQEMQAVLSAAGITPLRAVDGETLKRAERELLTAFPSLWFVSLEKRGFYLTVTAEAAPVKIQTEPIYTLSATEAGVVQSITVLQGIPLVRVGDRVEKGQDLVRGGILSGTDAQAETRAPVIAEVVLLCSYSEQRLYASENEHLLQLLKQNTISSLGATATQTDNSRIEKTENGYLYTVEFTYFSTLIGGNPWKQKAEE